MYIITQYVFPYSNIYKHYLFSFFKKYKKSYKMKLNKYKFEKYL